MCSLHLVYALRTSDPTYLNHFYASRRIKEEALEIGLDFSMELASSFDTSRKAQEPTIYDGLLVRGDYPISSMYELERHGYRIVNPARAHELCIDKLKTAEWLIAYGWPHPWTIQYVNEAKQFPFILKPRFGKMGNGIFLIENEAGLMNPSVRTALDTHEYLIQEFIETSYGKDVRFFFADFEESSAISYTTHCSAVCVKRQGSGLVSNAHAGGSMEVYKPEKPLADLAYAIFSASGLVYGTVDFLFANDAETKFVVCELNSMPGFEELERASGINVAKAILYSCSKYL